MTKKCFYVLIFFFISRIRGTRSNFGFHKKHSSKDVKLNGFTTILNMSTTWQFIHLLRTPLLHFQNTSKFRLVYKKPKLLNSFYNKMIRLAFQQTHEIIHSNSHFLSIKVLTKSRYLVMLYVVTFCKKTLPYI